MEFKKLKLIHFFRKLIEIKLEKSMLLLFQK